MFSESVSEGTLAGFSGFRGFEDGYASYEIERSDVRAFSRRALDELPVMDLTIEDMPLEAGIARLYRGETSDE